MNFNPEIFRAYDIRGIYGRDFDDEFAFRLGSALVHYLKRRKFLVAHDDRSFSPSLAESFIRGVTSMGGDVEFLGLSTTPLFNFTFGLLGVDGGAIIAASHNPIKYGGFKIFGEAGRILGLSTGLEQVKNMMEDHPESSRYGGRVNSLGKSEILNKYVDFILKRAKMKSGPAMKVRVEPPIIAQEELNQLFEKLGIANSPADYNVKFAFDADEDRISVFDRDDKPIHSDYITAILMQDMLLFWSKPKVVYDLRFSKGVVERFKEWGIRHFRSRVGRSFIKDEATLRRADISGELSGHIFFKEASYNELPLLAMLRILKIMNRTGKNIDELAQPFRTWENSGEINMEIQNSEVKSQNDNSKFNFFGMLKEKYKDGKINELDGITVEYNDWWFNVRASNTEPLIRLVVEAKTKDLLDEKVAEIKKGMDL